MITKTFSTNSAKSLRHEKRLRHEVGTTGTVYVLNPEISCFDTVASSGADQRNTRPAMGRTQQALRRQVRGHLPKPAGVSAVAVDNAGNVLTATQTRIQVLAGKTGRFYGKAARAGGVYTIAGNGTGSADGTPALSAKITAGPVAVDQAGNLLTASGSTIWMVAERAGSYYGKVTSTRSPTAWPGTSSWTTAPAEALQPPAFGCAGPGRARRLRGLHRPPRPGRRGRPGRIRRSKTTASRTPRPDPPDHRMTMRAAVRSGFAVQ
jgi:hypothetical protein